MVLDGVSAAEKEDGDDERQFHPRVVAVQSRRKDNSFSPLMTFTVSRNI